MFVYRTAWFIEAFQVFWRQNPGLLYGIASLLGAGLGLSFHPALLIPVVMLMLPGCLALLLPGRRQDFHDLLLRLGLSLLLLLAFCALSHARYQLPTLPPSGVMGQAEIAIGSVSAIKSPFGMRWSLKGQLKRFDPAQNEVQNVNVRNANVQLSIPYKPERTRPSADQTYQVYGKLKQQGNSYHLSVKSDAYWRRLPGSGGLAEWRYRTKQAFVTMLQERMPNPRSAAFIAGLATGEFSDRATAAALGRFGLQHIMAISGFNFVIVAAFLSLVLRGFLPSRITAWLLLILLCAYFILLGPDPSVTRAWIAVLIAVAGDLLSKRSRGLNTLGVALMLMLLVDPSVCQSVALQLSFLATAAILLFLPLMEPLLQQMWPKRPLHQLVRMPWWDQHAVVMLALFRGALALGIAVHVVMIPVLLFYFNKFPLLSLLYNLFFPFLVSVSILLLLIALPLQLCVPPLATLIHHVNSTYTQWVLDLTFNMPMNIDFIWRVGEVSLTPVIAFLTAITVIGICLTHNFSQRFEERQALAYL